MDLIDLFNKEYNKNAVQYGVTGTDLSAQRKNFQPVTEDDKKVKSSMDYLKDGVTLSKIHALAKNKKLSNNRIKSEIKKLLKDPEELNDFLLSFKKLNTNKRETTEVTASGAGVGMFSGPLSGPSGEEPKKVEATEATGSGSSGQYSTPAAWAKSTNKKDWRGKSKTQIPGGKFVQVKKKCKKFPYCNQGDIKALNIFENETVKGVIQKVSERYNLHEDHIKNIILHELSKTNK